MAEHMVKMNAKTLGLLIRLMHVRRGNLQTQKRLGLLTAEGAEELTDVEAAIDELELREREQLANKRKRRDLYDLAPTVSDDPDDDVEPLL